MRRVQIEKITKRAPESVCASAEDHHGRGSHRSYGTVCYDLLCNDAGIYIYKLMFRSEATETAGEKKEGRV